MGYYAHGRIAGWTDGESSVTVEQTHYNSAENRYGWSWRLVWRGEGHPAGYVNSPAGHEVWTVGCDARGALSSLASFLYAWGEAVDASERGRVSDNLDMFPAECLPFIDRGLAEAFSSEMMESDEVTADVTR